MRKIVILVGVMMLFGMTGCKKVINKAAEEFMQTQNTGSGNAATTGNQENLVDEVMNSYISASNDLTGSLRDDIHEYIDAGYGKKDVIKNCSQPVSLSALKSALNNLKEARNTTLGAPYEQLESSADEFIKTLTPFVETVEALDSHVKSKGYLEDQGAFIKEQDAKYIEQSTAFLKAMDSFEAVLGEVTAKREADYVAKLRAEGKVKYAEIQEIYIAFKKLLSLYNTDEDFRNPEVQEKTNTAIDEISKMLEAYSADVAKEPDDKHFEKFKEMERKYNELLGQARTFKNDKYSTKEYETLVKDFNRFVQFELNFMWTWR